MHIFANGTFSSFLLEENLLYAPKNSLSGIFPLPQTMGDNRAAEYMRGRRTLEVNPDHPIVAGLAEALANERDAATATTELLYETALITSGFAVDSPRDFAARIYDMIGLAVAKSGGKAAAPAAAAAAPATGADGEPARPQVDPEVLGVDLDDPWRK